MAAAVRTPIRFRPWARPTVVVVLPSPSGVGVIAVTTISLPSGRSVRRSYASGETFALYVPYSSISSSLRPRSRAIWVIGRSVASRAISSDDFMCAAPVVACCYAARRLRP